MIFDQSMPHAARPALHLESRIDTRLMLNTALLLVVFMPAYYWLKGGMTMLLWFCALILPILVFKYIQMTLDKRPHLLLNETGITWHQWPCGTVRWLDVKRVYTQHYYSSEYLCFELFNEKDYLKKISFLRRFAKPLGMTFFSIPVGFLDRHPADLFDIITTEIQMRRAQLQAHSAHGRNL